MITLKQLKQVQAVIRHGSLSRAAEVLHITAPALTRSLALLEDDLGVQLFDRSKSGMQATDFCLQIESRCNQLLCDVDDLIREAALYRQSDNGRLNLGVGRAVRELVLRPVLPDFVVQFPNIQVHVTEGNPEELVEGLYNRQFDLLLAGFIDLETVDGLSYQPLKSIPAPIFARPQHPLHSFQAISFQQLFKYPMLAATQLSSDHPLAQFFAGGEGALPPVHLLCSDYQLLKQTVLRTDAWLPAPVSQFSAELAAGELITLEVPSWSFVAQISAIELTGRSRSPAAQHFLDLCLQRSAQW